MIEAKKGIGGRDVEKGLGVAPDYANAWMMPMYIVKEAAGIRDEREVGEFLDLMLPKLKPIENYQDYFIKKDFGDTQNRLNESDFDKVISINKLVEEFNAALPEIKAKKDIERLRNFATKINLLVRGSTEF